MNRACLPKEKHQKIHRKNRAKFMNFSFWPFIWFGLPGRLLILSQGFSGVHSRKKYLFFPWFSLLLSGPLRLRVQSRSRTRLRIAASIAFLLHANYFGARLKEIKGRFRKRVVFAHVPSFRFSFRGNILTYPRSGFSFRGNTKRTLVPVFVPGEHPPKPPFWKPPFCQPQS